MFNVFENGFVLADKASSLIDSANLSDHLSDFRAGSTVLELQEISLEQNHLQPFLNGEREVLFSGNEKLDMLSADFNSDPLIGEDLEDVSTLWNEGLTAYNIPSNYPLTQAIDLGAIETVRLRDFVGDVAPSDIYRFHLGIDSDINILLNGLTADADLALIQDVNQNLKIEPTDIIQVSQRPYNFSEYISVNALPAGTYYVVVYQYRGNTTYNLSLSARPNPQFQKTELIEGYNSSFGYGLVDASAAVAQAMGLPKFPDVPNLGGHNWGRDLIKAPEVWAQGITGENVVVAVIDSGVDYNHPELFYKIWNNPGEIWNNGIDDDKNGYIDDVRGWDFVSQNNNPMDFHGHGTHVAGIIAAADDGIGMTGVAPNATIMPIRVLDRHGLGRISETLDGIRYAVENGADVINLSLGGNDYITEVLETISWAVEQGVVVVVAAGNESRSFPSYPARFANQAGIAVGSVDRYNQLSNFSNRAGISPLDYVVAPGGDGGLADAGDIYSTIPLGSSGVPYRFFSGTSMAAPHVSGVVALMLQANPNLTPTEVEQILIQTADRSTIVG